MARERKPAEPSVSDSLVREKQPAAKYFFSTGCTLLDLAIANQLPGGVASGRTTQIIGDNSTAKTVLAKEILGSTQRQGGYAIEAESEFTPDWERAELFGLDVGDWKDEHVDSEVPIKKAVLRDSNYTYRNPETISSFFDEDVKTLVEMCEAGEVKSPVTFCMDTFTALPSAAEMLRTIEEGSYNTERAKAMSAGYRKYVGSMGKQDITIIAVDHIRDNVGATFGKKWTTSGGKAMQQYASTRIFLTHMEKMKNSHEAIIGVKIKFDVVKNKIGPPFRTGFFYVLFDFGIDNIRGNLEWIIQTKIESKFRKEKNTWYCGETKLGGSLEKAILFIEDNELDNELEDEVARIWKIVYETTDRKRKHR